MRILHWAGFILTVASATFVIAWLRLIDQVDNRGVIEIMILLALVLVTMYYAISTQDIAQATKKSLRQGVRPILAFDHALLKGAGEIRLSWRNEGIGPSLNIRCFVELTDTSGNRTMLNRGRGVRATGNEPLSLLSEDYLPVGQRFVTHEERGLLEDVEHRPGIAPTWDVKLPFDFADTVRFKVTAIYRDLYDDYFRSQSEFTKGASGDFLIGTFGWRELPRKEAEKELSKAGFSV